MASLNSLSEKFIVCDSSNCGRCVAARFCFNHGINIMSIAATLPVVEDPEVDPNGLNAHAPGAKLDSGKVMPWLCIAGFSNALMAVALVTTKGAIKYTPNGWTQVANGEQRYMEAFGRHMLALGQGEQIDADTDCLHKAQMIWNLLASLELELRSAKECQQNN